MKQMHIVRYADDYKIFCKDYETASKIKIAVCKWLKERLNLEVSQKKTKITNLKSRITKETKSRLAYKLKKQIKVIQKESTQKQIAKLLFNGNIS